jgi:OmcA/MtrC family decaheme c-type cytochrome
VTGLTEVPAAGTAFMFSTLGPNDMTATTVQYVGGTRPHDIVSNQACINCHGLHVWRGAPHDVTSGQGVEACTICHNRVGATEKRLTGADSTATPPVTAYPGTDGTGLMGIVHGIHNSKNMPDGTYTWVWTNQTSKSDFSLGFPSYMMNCEVCHDGTTRLAAVKDAPVSFALCMSCHDSWDAFPKTQVGGSAAFLHRSITANSGPACSTCHTGAAATIAGFHNGLRTERAGLIWDGTDQSVVLGATIDMQITGVSFADTTLKVTWVATQDGTTVNPCNTDIAAGPVFIGATANATTGMVASNMSLLRGIAQADDWVNAGQTGTVSPGQPISVNLSSSNTKCAGGVATVSVARETYMSPDAVKGIVAIQGKPQVRFAPGIGTANEVIQVRAKTPTREYLLASGALPSELRRPIVATSKCLDCHVGSLYQHGGNRIDNNDLCVMCHNPAANEKNNRVGMGVTADEAYDGKVGEAYDMRNMVHAIHSAGETGMPLVYYRSNGIYFFGTKDALAAVTTWPRTGGVTCTGAEGPVTYYKVYGSSATGTVPERNADGTCKTTGLLPSTDGTWRIHNFIEVHYPQGLNNCGACHATDWPQAAVDATKATALTVDPGAAPWGNQLDDVLMGPTAASCMSCHQSADPTWQFGLRIHAYGQGWVPSTFENGRQTLIDAASQLP